MKKLFVIALFVGFSGFSAEEAKNTEHTGKVEKPAATEPGKKVAEKDLTQDKLAKLNSYIQACSVNRPSATNQLGKIK